jgi:hypothetical protein
MRSAAILVTLALAGCASSQGQVVYVAPTNQSISTTTEEGRGSSPAHEIYVINGSTEPITVFGVALRSCENVKQQCEPRQVDVAVPAGSRRVVLRVEPRNVDQAYSYQFSYSWRPAK